MNIVYIKGINIIYIKQNINKQRRIKKKSF